MNGERLHQSFLEMVAIESPSWSEAAMASYCRCVLEELGFRVYIDNSAVQTGSDTGNLIAYLPGTVEGHVAFCAHLDTVQPCTDIEVVRRVSDAGEEIFCTAGDTILSADDKAGIAAIFEGIRVVLERGDKRPAITVILTTCEEQSLLGSSALEVDCLEAGVPCFVLDADGDPGTIIVGAPCHYTLRAAIEGRAAHAGVEPEAGVSAIQIAAKAIAAMPLGRIDELTTANIGMIAGGVAVNIVADTCTVEGECRSIDRARAEEQKAAMEQALSVAAQEAGGSVNINWTLDYPEIVLTEESELIRHAVSALHACGLKPHFTHTGGGADANVLAGRGIDAVTLGIGMTNFHSSDEFIALRHLEEMALVVSALIREYASEANC